MQMNVLEKYLDALVAKKSDKSIYDPKGINVYPVDKTIPLAEHFNSIDGMWGTLVEHVDPRYAIYGPNMKDGAVCFEITY